MQYPRLLMATQTRPRCRWAEGDRILSAFHDDEWGERPMREREYFERLVLEMFQAGVATKTVLRKREALREAFGGFEPAAVAAFGEADVERICADTSIPRNRGKVEAAIQAARVFVEVQREHGSFAEFLRRGDETRPYRALQPRLRLFSPTVAEAFFRSVGAIPVQHEPSCWKRSR